MIKRSRHFHSLRLVAVSLFCLATVPAYSLDANKWYKLTTQWQGDGKALDVINDGKNNRLQLARTGNYSGQFWKFTPIRDDFYRLTTQWQGDNKALDVINDGKNNQLQLATKGDFSGQFWKITPASGGYYRLTTLWQGDGKSLDVINDGKNNKLQLAATGNYSGQFWKLTPVKTIQETTKKSPGVRTVNAGPIWNQADANKKCPEIAKQNGAEWTGQWWTTVQGKMSVCQIQ